MTGKKKRQMFFEEGIKSGDEGKTVNGAASPEALNPVKPEDEKARPDPTEPDRAKVNKREEDLRKREEAVAHRERTVALKEVELKRREEAVIKKEHLTTPMSLGALKKSKMFEGPRGVESDPFKEPKGNVPAKKPELKHDAPEVVFEGSGTNLVDVGEKTVVVKFKNGLHPTSDLSEIEELDKRGFKRSNNVVSS